MLAKVDDVLTLKLPFSAQNVNLQLFSSPFPCTQVNLDYQTTQEVKEKMKHPDKDTFSKAQHSIYLLMARDSFVRFVKAEPFQQALKR